MKMPIFSYFLVTGLVLSALLIFASAYIEPDGESFRSSQSIGAPRAFKPEPERSPYAVTATNFAASRAKDITAPAHVPAKAPTPLRNEKANAMRKDEHVAPATGSGWNRMAANPYDELMSIH